MKLKLQTKTQLAAAYGINIKTLNNWLTDIPDLALNSKQRILTPKQVHLIYKHLGAPDN